MNNLNELKLAIRRRFEFIEFCLVWDGKVGRPQLQDQFLISSQQATKDLTTYADSYPENMNYDPRKRAYITTQKFQPKLIEGSASEYFMHLQMLASRFRSENEIWIQSIPNFDIVAPSSRRLPPETVGMVVSAIKEKKSLTAKYLSLSTGNDAKRTLYPHAIASDGHRWHMRAYHLEKERYSDFVLSRLSDISICESSNEVVPQDSAWHTKIQLELEPDIIRHDQKRHDLLAFEYEMKNGVLKIDTRIAMLFYVLRYYGFNPYEIENGAIRNKSSLQLKIKNLKEIEQCLGRRK